MRSPLSLAVVTSTLLVLLCGCADSAGSPGAATTSFAAVSGKTAPASGPNDTEASLPAAPPAATENVAATAAAVVVAQQAMENFARPTVDADTWFSDLAPLLSETARANYVGTDPAEVPAHTLTGSGQAQASPSAYLAYVTVPTDVGTYQLLLSREGGDSAWLVETITPPAGVQ